MNKSYDVIVIGAGPAGSLAALKAAQGGARTLLLEKHSQVGQPVCCAEGITIFGLERVIRMRPEWVSAHVEGARIIAPNGYTMTIMYPNAGVVLDRTKFDPDLAEMAREAGAEIMLNSPVVELKMNGNNIVEAVVDQDGTPMSVAAKIFIGADGVESRVAQMAGIEFSTKLADIDSACQYLAENVMVDSELIALYLGNDIAPGGYAWIFPKGKSIANIGIAICPARSNGKTAQEYLDIFMARHFPGYKRLKTMMGIIPAFNPRMPLVRGNLLFAGDAARVIDSLSDAGIANALLSGSLAGLAAAGFVCRGKDLNDYPSQFMKLKSRELYAYKLFRSLYLKVTDDDFNRIVEALDEFFPEKKVRSINVPDTIFKLILKNPHLLKLARYMISR